MKNMINWFEIPANDFKRAVGFYKEILSVEIKETSMMGTDMGFFPSDERSVSGAIVKGDGYTPTADGAVVYLNGGENLQNILSKVEKAGGQVLVPKTQISPEMGYFAMFMDTEGNKMALHSIN